MAGANVDTTGPISLDMLDWRRDNARDMKSRAKAERILGVPNHKDVIANDKTKKRTGHMNFSFTDLRDALPALHRRPGKAVFQQQKTSDTESIASARSSTFDPSTSTTSLNTTSSSPVAAELKNEQARKYKSEDTLSQAETLRTRKEFIPSKEDNGEHLRLFPMELPALGLDVRPTSRRNHSLSSLVSFGSDSTGRRNFQVARSTSRAPSRDRSTPKPVQRTVPAPSHAGKHMQEWFEKADFDRRLSLMTRASAMPISAALSSSGESIVTLTSETTQPAENETSNRSSATQWPFPSTELPAPHRTKRIHKTDLHLESVLSFSSDEESDEETNVRRGPRYSERKSYSPVKHSQVPGHQRTESNGSSVIQLDSKPWVRPLFTPIRTFPRRSLADIAAAGSRNDNEDLESHTASEPDTPDTPDTTPDLDDLEQFLASLIDYTPTAIHPLRPSSAGSGDIDVRMSRPPHPLQPLPEEEPMEALVMGENDEEEAGDVDVSSFPIPPRSRAGSTVPSIHVQATDGSKIQIQAPLTTPTIDFSHQDGILLSPTTMGRSGSNSPLGSMSSRKKRQSIRAMAFDIDAVMRKRTLSNTPIYVTGLESTPRDHEIDDGDVASYVFSSIF